MRRALALLVLLAFVVPAVPAAPKTCEMGCAKTSACCCAKRGTETAETRLTLPSERCCRSTGVMAAAGATQAAAAGIASLLPSLAPSLALPAFPKARPSDGTPSAPRAPPVLPVAI